MSVESALDLTATVLTPENVQFQYRLAGPFKRFPAFLLDIVIRVASMWCLVLLLLFAGLGGMISFAETVGTVLFFVLYFLFDWFYGLFFETIWNGKTPGKHVSGLRVISIDGRPISAYQATLRNFLRLGDLAPLASLQVFVSDAVPLYWIPTGGVAILCMIFTSRMQRLGDIAAGTMVVIDDRKWIPPRLKLSDPIIEKLLQEISPSFQVSRTMLRAVALYVEKRTRLPTGRRRQLAFVLANELFEEAGVPSTTDPDLLLCAIYKREYDAKWSKSTENPTFQRSSTSITQGIEVSR